VPWRRRRRLYAGDSIPPEDTQASVAYAALEWVIIVLLLIKDLLFYAVAIVREPS
jgi:hypothetical protein